MKVYLVTQIQRVSKKYQESRVVGFVSAFGWESQYHAAKKASEKYPYLKDYQIHEYKTWRR